MSDRRVIDIPTDAEGVFLSRPNRFLANVSVLDVGGENVEVAAHVHDPGRLTELLYEGNRLILRKGIGPSRKTGWDVIAAANEGEWILINTAFHRRIAEWLLAGEQSPLGDLPEIRAEVSVGDSRLDFVAVDGEGRTVGIETKGCTLAIDGRALFPDAPTKRGAKHVRTLIGMVEEGHRAAALVLVFRPEADGFSPNADTDPDFARVLKEAVEKGVEVHAVKFSFDGVNVRYIGEIPVDI